MTLGKVKVFTKSNEVIEGVLMPYEDLEAVKEFVPMFSFFKTVRKEGIFIFTKEDKISFVHRDEIDKVMTLKLV